MGWSWGTGRVWEHARVGRQHKCLSLGSLLWPAARLLRVPLLHLLKRHSNWSQPGRGGLAPAAHATDGYAARDQHTDVTAAHTRQCLSGGSGCCRRCRWDKPREQLSPVPLHGCCCQRDSLWRRRRGRGCSRGCPASRLGRRLPSAAAGQRGVLDWRCAQRRPVLAVLGRRRWQCRRRQCRRRCCGAFVHGRGIHATRLLRAGSSA